MKMSRFQVAILMLLAVTVIYPVALHLDIQRYEAWKQYYLQSHPDLAPWIDFNPYTGTFTGGLMFIMGVLLGGFWLLVIVHRKKLKTAMLMILMFIVVSSFTPRAYAGYYEKTIDVLAVQDEEFRFLYPAGWQRDLGWGIYIDAAFGRFEEEFGMTFELRGWIDWDSTDYAPSLVALLDEAITETNFESHVTTYNSYVIDILMVFTSEPQTQARGFSHPEWEALIIYALPDAPRGRLVQHELSHQFWAEHCNNNCLMNTAKWELGQWVPDYWCGQCAATINDNKDRFWRWISSSGGGGGCPTLFVWDGSQYVEEALLDIHADSDVTLEHTIGETLVPDKNFYKLSLGELDEFTSHIDYVKLYVVDSDDGEMHETHLTKAIHSELGDVKELLLHDDDTRVDLTPEQTIDLRFTVPNIDEVAYFIFEINGYNYKTPIDGPISGNTSHRLT